jgi:hypothetical protein
MPQLQAHSPFPSCLLSISVSTCRQALFSKRQKRVKCCHKESGIEAKHSALAINTSGCTGLTPQAEILTCSISRIRAHAHSPSPSCSSWDKERGDQHEVVHLNLTPKFPCFAVWQRLQQATKTIEEKQPATQAQNPQSMPLGPFQYAQGMTDKSLKHLRLLEYLGC